MSVQGVDYARLEPLVRWRQRGLTDPLKDRLRYYSYRLEDLQGWRALKGACSNFGRALKGR
jgi:hypothetical protein